MTGTPMFDLEEDPEEPEAEPAGEDAVGDEGQEGEEPEEDIDWRQRFEQLDRRYRESSKEGRRLHGRAQNLEQELRQREERLRQLETLMASQNRGPDEAAKLKERLEPDGFPVEDLAKYVQTEVERGVESRLMPLLQSIEAHSRVDLEEPGFAENKPKILRFLQENPDKLQRYQALNRGDPAGAARWAELEWQLDEARRKEDEMYQDDSKARQDRARRRTDARTTKPKSGREAARQMTAKEEQEALEQMINHGQETGDYSAYVRARLAPIVDKVKWADFDE